METVLPVFAWSLRRPRAGTGPSWQLHNYNPRALVWIRGFVGVWVHRCSLERRKQGESGTARALLNTSDSPRRANLLYLLYAGPFHKRYETYDFEGDHALMAF